MEAYEIFENELKERIMNLETELDFFGTINYIEKKDQHFITYIDLFNLVTNELDDNLLFNGKIKNVTYSLDLVIETPNLTILGHSNELFKFKIVNSIDNCFDTFEGNISFFTNNKYDSINPFRSKKIYIKVSKATQEEKYTYKKRIEQHLKFLENYIDQKEKYCIKENKNKFKKGIQYSQYHVGLGSCSYINIGGISKGFFNIGYSNKRMGKRLPYSGFSKHKPDWIILSNINKDRYNAALRYGNHELFSCVWIIPNVTKYNINFIRLLYCIINSGGKVIILKYKANASVCSFIKDDVKLEVYYTTEYDMNTNGLSLYIENKDKFISFGNSDYNFLTKSLVKQNFDLIVLPYQGSKLKTKIHSNSNIQTNHDLKYPVHNSLDKHMRTGFHIHRTDLSGNFHCII